MHSEIKKKMLIYFFQELNQCLISLKLKKKKKSKGGRQLQSPCRKSVYVFQEQDFFFFHL